MGKKTKIEWAESSWNPWIGCQKVSKGCKHCYAERSMRRFGKKFSTIKKTEKTTFNSPKRWKKSRKIFVCSISDFFVTEAQEWRYDAWDVMKQAPQHIYILLTKRIENAQHFFRSLIEFENSEKKIYKNVWLGISAENQQTLSERGSVLMRDKLLLVGKKFLSLEPVIDEINLKEFILSNGKPDWVIAGGESHWTYIPKLDYFRKIRDDCISYNVPFFFKQVGGYKKINSHWGGNKIDGQVFEQFPS